MDAERELAGLWEQLFGEPPSIKADARILAMILVAALPLAPPYSVEEAAAAPAAAA